MATNRTRTLTAIVLTAAIFFGSAAVAAAGVVGGRYGGTNSDGSYARVRGNSFAPSSGQCVLFSTLANNETDPRQIQAGLVRCLNSPGLFGSCNHVKFVEVLYGGGGACYPKGSFSNGVYHKFKVQRIGNTNYFQAYVNGNPEESLPGFDYSDVVRIWAWGEWTGVGTCAGWGGSGTIDDWQKLDPVNGWVNLSGNPYADGCWTVQAPNGQGEWNVYR